MCSLTPSLLGFEVVVSVNSWCVLAVLLISRLEAAIDIVSSIEIIVNWRVFFFTFTNYCLEVISLGLPLCWG